MAQKSNAPRRKPKAPERPGFIAKVIDAAALRDWPTERRLGRRDFLKRFGAGAAGLALAFGGAKLAEKAAAPKHEITFVFLRHSKKEDLEHVEKMIEVARALGRPYHAIGWEAAKEKGILPEELEKYFIDHEKSKQLLENAIKHMRQNEGKNPKEAFSKAFEVALTALADLEDAEYRAARLMTGVKYGLPGIPIEAYEKKTSELLEKLDYKSKEHLAAGLSQPTLKEQMQNIEYSHRVLADYLRIRNLGIVHTIPRVIDLLRKHHPELEKEPSIRIIVPIGSAHRHLSRLFSNDNADFEGSFSKTPHLMPQHLIDRLTENPNAKLSDEEVARLVLAGNLHQSTGVLNEGDLNEAEELRHKISNITWDDFEKLDKMTKEMKLKKRAQTIYEYLKKNK